MRRWRKRRMKVTPMPDDAPDVTPADFAVDANVMAEASPDAAPDVTPVPAPDPDLPPGTVHVGLDFTPNAVAALRKAGFLAAGPASPGDIAVAVFGMLSAAWQAGITSDAQDETASEPWSTRASVPFMVTSEMKRRLRDLGYTDAQIREMRPAEAHQIINAA
jgi:hypothetical protein